MNTTTSHPPLYTTPPLYIEDEAVLGEIHRMRKDLRHVLRTPRRWEGSLRRAALARNIQGSNSIEGYDVAEDDAAAAIDGEEPFTADDRTFLEIQGYRQVLGYVRAMSDADYATFDTTELRAMHYMMLSHDLSKSPGRYRKGPVYVHDERSDKVVYEGPDATDVPALMEALAASLHTGYSLDPVIRSAMAHLNLVMIHPFRDGNGRMARALATLVLTRSDIGEPEFSSIEEWLGANTDDYYSALAHTGHGFWQPRADAHLWVTFSLRAHHMQAQTVARRVEEAAATWAELDQIASEHGLPDRAIDATFDAVLGYRVRRGGYIKRTQVTEQTATRDLAALTSAGVLTPHGNGRGRYYVAGKPLLAIRQRRRDERKPLRDPYPWMRAKLAEPADSQGLPDVRGSVQHIRVRGEMMGAMPSQDLIDRVAELRAQGRTPKEIARALGLKPAEVAPLIRMVGAAAPKREALLAGCWVSGNWSAGLTISGDHPDWPGAGPVVPDGESGLMGVLVAREHGSSVSVAGFLVDVWCMGVKDVNGPKTMDRRKLPDFVGLFFSAFSQPAVPAPLDLAQHVVFGAVGYARGLGLEPHPDFARCAVLLGEWSGPSDITFGKDGKPLYIAGPRDDTFRIMSTLRKTVGDDNFHFVMGAPG